MLAQRANDQDNANNFADWMEPMFKGFLVIPILICVIGCNTASRSGTSSKGESNSSDDKVAPIQLESTPEAVLERMAQTYRDALHYSDNARVRLRFRQLGRFGGDEAPLKVIWESPGKLRVEAYHGIAVADGEALYARVKDELSQEIQNQVLKRPLDGNLTLEQLYHDPLLREALTSGLGRQPIQLDLLFEDDPLRSILADDVPRKLLEGASFEDHACYRVQAETADGVFVFWVDQQSFLLRKMEYPAAQIIPELAEAEDVKDLELVAEFRDASFAAKADAAYTIELLPSSRQVRAFVLPPPPLPTDLFGKRPSKFEFDQRNGAKLGQDDVAGSISVLLWFNAHPACQSTVQQLNELVAKSETEDDVKFVAVSTDPSDVSNQEIERVLREWKVDLPFVRDLDAYGRDIFKIPWAPTVVVLARNGTVQIFEAGANPQLAKALTTIIERLREDADLAQEIIAQHEREQDHYAKMLEAATGEGSTEEIDLALANIRPRSEPTRMKIGEEWSVSEIPEPGNLLVVEDGEASRLLVLEEGRAIVELNSKGETIERRTLPLDGDRVSMLRSQLDGDGRRHYLAAAIQGRYAYWFDEAWQLQLRYPSAEQRHPGIFDLQLGDLNRDGELELLLGFAGEIGVQSVRPDGSRIWSNRTTTNVLSVVPGGGNERTNRLLVTSERGKVLSIRADGKSDPPLQTGQVNLFHLFAASWASDAETSYCAMSFSEAGNLVAIGLNDSLVGVWSYPLPVGTFSNPIQFVTSGAIGEYKFWCIAAADGSIHFVHAAGTFTDNFAYGRDLTGIALTDGLLVVSTRDAVEGWKVQLADPPAE